MAASAKPGLAAPGVSPPGPANALALGSMLSSNGATALIVPRPSPNHTLVYRADRYGHFALTAAVNGSQFGLLSIAGQA
jgi:hypothetical protein